MEQAIQPHAVDALKLALEGTTSEDVVTRRNAIYCAGAVMQFGGNSVSVRTHAHRLSHPTKGVEVCC